MLSRGILAAGLLSLAAAAPRPQDIDFDLADSIPDATSTVISTDTATAQTVTYTPSAIYESALPQITATTTFSILPATTDAPSTDASFTGGSTAEKRAASGSSCYALPSGAGPIPSPDSASAFIGMPTLSSIANAAQPPPGYSQAFQNLQASNNAYGYLGYTLLQTYDVDTCAAKCNAINGCMSINIYFERDPSQEPGSSSDSQCSNPPSTTNIKCVFWGGPVTAANAVNSGQWRNRFQVVIAGSNGYVNNSIASVSGYGQPAPLGKNAINAPYDQYGYDSYLGSAIFTGGPFNASLCAQACSEKSAYAIRNPPTDGSPIQTCQFFNTYILYINSTSKPANNQGQYCAMYSESWATKYATNNGQWRGYDHYMIEYSFAYSNATNPGAADPVAAVAQASRDISYSTLQAFCGSYLGYTTPLATATATSTSVTTVTTSVSSVTGTATVYAFEKRTLSTPDVLTKYPSAILSSACSLQTSAPAAATTTTTLLTVSSTTTTSVIPYETTSSLTTSNFILQLSAPGTQMDGQQIANSVDRDQTALLVTGPKYPSIPVIPLRFHIDPSTNYLQSANGSFLSYYTWQGLNGANARTNATSQLQLAFGPNSTINAAYNTRPTCARDPQTSLLSCSAQGPKGFTADIFYVYAQPSRWWLALGEQGLVNQPYLVPVQVLAVPSA